jgi:heme-degrading monooxygenase HmoA
LSAAPVGAKRCSTPSAGGIIRASDAPGTARSVESFLKQGAEVTVIVHMSIHTPRAGKEDDLIASMHRFAAAAQGAPGLVDVRVLKDRRSGRLIGMARWEDEASWRAGVEAMGAAVADDPLDEWEAEETQGFLLDEV